LLTAFAEDAAASYRLLEEVSVRDFGAVGNGIDDDSKAFQAALNAASAFGKKVVVPACPAYYVVGNVTIPDGSTISGVADRPYVASIVNSVSGVGGAIVRRAGAQALFLFGNRVTLDRIVMHGVDRSVQCTQPATGLTKISGLTLVRCGIYGFSTAVGGDAAIGMARIIDCNIASNARGVTNIVDSQVMGGYVNANSGIGIYLGNGANDNSIVGVKNEWNGADNLNVFQSVSNVVVGGVIDRAGTHNVFVGASAELVIAGTKLRRAGRSGNGSNLRLESARKFVGTGIVAGRGADDDGTGLESPSIGIQLTGTNGRIILSSCDVADGFVTSALVRSGTVEQLIVQSCPGLRDIEVRPGQFESVGSVAALQTLQIQVPLLPLETFSQAAYQVDVVGRASVGGIYGIGQTMIVRREGGAGGVGGSALNYAIGSAGTGTEQMVVTVTGISADGGSCSVSIKNNRSDAAIAIRLKVRTIVA